MNEEKKTIESFKRYIIFQESTLDDYYKMDEEYYKDQIEQLELSIKLLKTVLNLLEKKDIDIIETKEANRQLSIELQKKDKIINLMEDEINKLLKDGFERIGLDVYLEKENITVREFIERKVESEEK